MDLIRPDGTVISVEPRRFCAEASLAFTSLADCVEGDDGWSIDDVEITAKAP